MPGKTTFPQYLINTRRQHPEADGSFNELLHQISLAAKAIARKIARGALAGLHGEAGTGANVQGEVQKKLDVVANDILLDCARDCEGLAALVSEEIDSFVPIHPQGKYLLACDPLDGSANIDINSAVGTIFSVLRRPDMAAPLSEADFLQPGRDQLAAGYVLYGPTTMLVISMGNGVHGFTLDPDLGEFILTHPDMMLPHRASVFAINASNRRFWEEPVKRYVEECLAGRAGPRGRDFNMRWIAALVAEAHRILLQGGVFLYPRDTKQPARAGRLRLLYEAAPMAFLLRQAGGRASTGRAAILDVVPDSIHQRIGLVFGTSAEVRRIEQYHALPREAEHAPLFGERSLFRD